ncbi:hypothetical protein IMZ48_32535 [Candidatus Bathyarchaeota archaeon]|nr:hypothetical protein [Candidatus Bathyarchaeota archaeon]
MSQFLDCPDCPANTRLPATRAMEVDTPADSQANGQGDSCLIRYLETRFPLELFLHLTDFMEDHSLQNLRLACRGMERALLPTFQKRFFAKRHVCLNMKSLRRFSDLCDNTKFGPQVSSISIGCVHSLSDSQDDDNALFIDCGYDVNLLTHALGNTPGLQAVTINFNPFFSRVNTSRNVSAALASDNPRKLLRKLLRALSEAGRELQSFDMEHHGGTGGGFLLSDLYLGDALAEDLSSPMRSVKRLSLALDPHQDPARQAKPTYIPQLAKFLGIPRVLEHLRLNLDRDALGPTTTILETLACEAPSPFLHLTQLDLGKMTTTVTAFVGFVQSVAKTLTRLQLFRIGLMFALDQGYPHDHPNPIQPDPTPHKEAALWRIVFRKMAAMPELEGLTRFYAGYLTEGWQKNHVSFRRSPPGAKMVDAPECEHTGAGAPAFLGGELSGNAILIVKPHNLPGPEDLTDEDDEGEDDDDDDDDDDEMD